MIELDYQPPVSELLALGDPHVGTRDWPDYVAMGLEMKHVPDLIRLAREWSTEWWDGTDETAMWGPVHAWRALGQLGDELAIKPLIEVMARNDDLDDDWSTDEIPRVFALIGPATIPALSDALADPNMGLWARSAAAHSLELIGNSHPKAREQCVAALTSVLVQYARLDPALNSFLVSSLIELKAVEAAPLMEKVFGSGNIDLSVQGDWEDVQIELGLLSERLTPRRNYPLASVFAPSPKPRRSSNKSKKKAKRKQQKASRRKNRKRR